MAFGVPNTLGAGNNEFQGPVFGDFDLLYNPPDQSDAHQANETVASSSSSVTPEEMEIDLAALAIQPHHNLVHYSVFNFEGGPLNVPPLPERVKEQILYATASYKDAAGQVHIHKSFGFSHLTPFEVATLYRVINSYHNFWENIQTPGQSIYHKHLDLLEEYMLGLAWEYPERANEVIALLASFQDPNVYGMIEKIVQENHKLVGLTRVEHANLLIQHAVLLFNYKDADNQQKFLSEAVRRQIQYAVCSYKNARGEVVIYKNFKFDHLSAHDLVMLYRVLDSYYRKWDLPQHKDDAIFDRHLARMEEYLVDLCWSNKQKATNVRAAIEVQMTTLHGLAGKMDQGITKLSGFALVPHAVLIEHYARINFNYDNDNLGYQPIPEAVKTLIRLSTKCYKNAEGNILVHKDFTFDHLTPAEFAHLYRILNSYYRIYDVPHHKDDAVYQKHLSMMEEYIEGLCWTDKSRMQAIRDILLTHADPYLHDIIEKQTSYLLNLLPYSLIDHSNQWFNFNNLNPAYSAMFDPLSDQVKEQIKFAVFTNSHVNGTKELHNNFKFDHLSSKEVAQLYVVIYSYYVNYDHPMNREVYKKHVKLLQRHIEDICWRDPVQGTEVCKVLVRYNSSGNMTEFIQKINGIIQFTTTLEPVRNADMLINYAERIFDRDILSEAVKSNLRLASVCYQTPNGIVIHPNFPSDDLSPEDLAGVYWIITSYSNEERYKFDQKVLFQNHLAVLEEHLEKLCWSDLEKVERVRSLLESFQDPSLQQMIVKLSYYIANLSGFNIINHADFWFPWLSEPVKQQVRYATLYHLQIYHSIPSLHPKFTFDHLSPSDLVTLYRVLKTYIDLPFAQDTSDYRLHFEKIDTYIAVYLPNGNTEKAKQVRELMLTMNTPEDSINPILQKLNSHPELRYDRSLFRYLEEQDKYVTAQGGGANVYLYYPNAILKKVVPPTQGVALKAYFTNTNEEERYIKLFSAEVDFLTKMQGYPGVPKLLDINPATRMIMMSAITDKNGLKIIQEEPRRLKEVCVKHMRSLVRLHVHTNTAFQIPAQLLFQEGSTLAKILDDKDLGCVTNFLTTIRNGPDQQFTAQAQASVHRFIQRQAMGNWYQAKCLNDTCIESYFPESDIFIDFNAATTSPVERDTAAGIVNLLLNLKYNIGVNPTIIEMKDVLLGMINSYEEEYRKFDPNFNSNIDLFRFFFAQQVTILASAIYLQGNQYAAKKLQDVVLDLLDTNQEFTIETMVDRILAGY